MERHWHFLFNEELTTLNNNGFYSEIDFFIEHLIFASVIIFLECKFSLNTGDIYVGIVVLILFL
ncbi:hypothetical protein BMS56_01920 [Salmonella enterica]|uniref:Uncharacterized protein n=5 Tax=Salmonella enterica I TaxID=59201 RepID=A0A3Y4IGN6_SALET|nr:hypothetical protein AC247_24120 [Salmonella enterica subsp. enterica serovar Ouakam]ANF78510.1 hypothetical protein A7P63_13220 [Salmonella enterica]ASG11685.1 hypothetical protein LFZ36_10435 [Salmonella enterica subsp. enterica serovar Ouakam str. SA20034636]ASG71561.1 hypothetical protein CE137_13735 [Salmonella enterica subsp. enterica serovar Waycross]ASN56758.1 hypothetical protein CGL53_14230 [Salmonella enterica subsp. enterica serovar Indiana]EAA0498737.1 hypothetical protein [Sal